MKRYLLFVITGAILLWNSSGQAVGVPGSLGENGGANSNPHNLSSLSGNTKKALTETQICIFCHTPHGARPQTTLWSRPNPSSMGTFPTFAEPSSVQDPSGILGINDAGISGTTLYGNNTSPNEYPNGASKLCLSCHDGVTAMGILASGDELDMVGGAAIGIDLAVSHPISFVYNSTVQTYLNTLGKTDTYKWPTSAYLSTDSAGKTWVQCTICHQPHQDTKNATYILPFWRGAGTNDITEYNAICSACHTTTYNNATLPDHQYP